MKKRFIKTLTCLTLIGVIFGGISVSAAPIGQYSQTATTRSFTKTTPAPAPVVTPKPTVSYAYSGVLVKESGKFTTVISGKKYTLIGSITGMDSLVGKTIGINGSVYNLSVGGLTILVTSYGLK